MYVSIHEFAYQPPLFAGFLTLIFCGFLASVNAAIWLLYYFLKPQIVKSFHYQCLAFATTALISESLRSYLFTGFPWLFSGYSQTNAILSGWAPVVGVYGISFLIYLTGALIAGLTASTIFRNKLVVFSSRPTVFASAVLVAWLVSPMLRSIDWTVPVDQPLRVSLVQTNISQHDKWKPDNLLPSLELYEAMSQTAWKHSDLVIWPEAAIPKSYHAVKPFLNRISSIAKANQSTLLTGIPYRDQEQEKTYNSIVVLGNGSGLYHKQRLVPFGEYTPFESLLGPLSEVFDLPLASMSAGLNSHKPLRLGNWQSQPLICYEVVYPLLAAKHALQSDVLITISNDSWFGHSIGPLQHLQMAQMRALENGRFMLRGTGNGVSAIISPKGEIINSTQQFQQMVLQGEVQKMTGSTPWARWGVKSFAVAQLILVIALVIIRWAKPT